MHQLSHVRVQRRETLEGKIETKIPQFEQFFQREQFLEISLCPSLPGFPNSFLPVQPSTSEDEIFMTKGLKMKNFDKLFGKRFVYEECVNVVAGETGSSHQPPLPCRLRWSLIDAGESGQCHIWVAWGSLSAM